MMIKLVIASGLGFDCASPREIYKIRQFNICPSSIIYAVTMKTPEQMMYARESGVVHTTFDSSCELKKLQQYWPDARLLIRIRIDGESVYKLGEKFGCDFETEAKDLLEEAASLELAVVGVAFHVGSGCLGIQSYMVGLQQAKALFEYESRAGRGMRILDIGGEFFSRNNERFDKVSKLISDGLDELFPDPDVQIVAEPGRYLSESAFTLYCNIKNFDNVSLPTTMKANDTEIMLKLAIALGVGFGCASPGEIYKIRQLNVSPKSIMYAMSMKTPEQMLYARNSGVKHTTFDTSYELKNLKKYWPDARAMISLLYKKDTAGLPCSLCFMFRYICIGMKAIPRPFPELQANALLIRIRVESDSKIKFGDKFGCKFKTEAIDLLEEAASLGLKVVGAAFHVGSMCHSSDSYAVGLRQAKALFDHEARAGRGMKIVDIGGGFRGDNIIEISKFVNKTIEELFPDPSIQIIAKPGRFLSESSFKLFCNISNVRKVKKNDKPVNMIFINDGIYGTMRYSDERLALSKFRKKTEIITGNLEDVIIWGPSCDNRDRIMKSFTLRLPTSMPLDWLVIANHGAYTMAYATSFSSLEIPLIRPVVSLELWTKLKDSTVFEPSDFIFNADISSPLPSTLPPILPKKEVEEHIQISSFIM